MNRRDLLGSAVALAALTRFARAADRDVVAVVSTQRGNWDTGVAELGQRAGIFRKHGLELKITWTQGGGEAQQAVISGSVDIGTAVGIMGVLSAFSRGAPIRIISNEQTGAGDIYWYVKTSSPIRALADLKGETIAYSTNGSSSHSVVRSFLQENKVVATPVATGSAAVTLTQVMSGQIEVGWGAPPFGLEQLDRKQIRLVATGNDAKGMKERTTRVNVTNSETLTRRPQVVERFILAYRETVDWMYAGDDAIAVYADFAGISPALARRARDEFFPKAVLDPNGLAGLDALLEEAVALKYMTAPLSREKLINLIPASTY